MKLTKKIIGTVAILTVYGRIISTPDVTPLKTKIKNLTQCGIHHIVIDLSHIKWFGATMLGTLVDALATTQKAGGDIRLVGVNKRIHQILNVTQLANTFQTTTTVARAVGSFYTTPTYKPKMYTIGGGALTVTI